MINFSSGPAYLDEEIKQTACEAIQGGKFNHAISIFELGHRTKEYKTIVSEIERLLSTLLEIQKSEWHFFLLQGGATMQFLQIPYNFIPSSKTATYIKTGTWSDKAIKEAQTIANINTHELNINETDFQKVFLLERTIYSKDVYSHITTNETIDGVQFPLIPKLGKPIIADVSSDILSRKMDLKPIGALYAGAQKNLGIAGVTLLLVRKDFFEQAYNVDNKKNQLSYAKYFEQGGIPNTPPVFAVYVLLLSLQKIVQRGGLVSIEKENDLKATTIYDVLDQYVEIFELAVPRAWRSKMNIIFNMKKKKQEERFIEEAEKEGFFGIRGHRTKGGIRLSLYNHIRQKTHIEPFVQFMRYFINKKV